MSWHYYRKSSWVSKRHIQIHLWFPKELFSMRENTWYLKAENVFIDEGDIPNWTINYRSRVLLMWEIYYLPYQVVLKWYQWSPQKAWHWSIEIEWTKWVWIDTKFVRFNTPTYLIFLIIKETCITFSLY